MTFTSKSAVLRSGLTLALAATLAGPLAAQTASISVTLDSTQLRRTIPADFLGLSLEMSSIEAANNNGAAWLSGNSTAYSTMVSKIGVRNIRIGGNSAERQPYATQADAAGVDAFASLIGANLIWTMPVKQFYNQPVGVASSYTLEGPGYGLWAFHYGSQGQPLSTAVNNPSNANVSAYGLLETSGGETLHLINKTFGSKAVSATVKVTPGGSYTHAQVLYLQQANNDVTATSGITFGGAPMDGGGNWSGGYGAQQSLTNGTFTITLPAAQAAIVHFY